MIIAAKSDIGLIRKQNQDCFATGELPGEAVWAVVCDGMGGAKGGNVASSLAVDIIAEKIRKCFNKGMTGKSVKNLLISAIDGSNISIFDMAKKDEKLTGMGTTVVAAIIADNKICIAHAGDSRAYIANKNGIRQLTKDHSVVQAMVENGDLTPDEARNHPQRNIITRALGVDESIAVDFQEEMIENDDLIIICTDGLTNFVDTENIYEIITNSKVNDVAEMLVAKAIQNGGGDNITVVAIANINSYKGA